jgi:ABC-2 type transport system permease protein
MGSRTIDLGWMINSGSLTIPLMRPINIFSFFFIRDLADKLFNLGFMFLELPLIYFIFRPPIFLQTNLYSIFLFACSTLMAILIYFYINLVFGSLAFWSRDIWAPRFLLMVIMEFATGAMFPLDMLPDLWQKIIFFTPFPYLVYVPLKIYLGTDSNLFVHLITSFAWVIIFGIIARIIWRKGIESYEAEGR